MRTARAMMDIGYPHRSWAGTIRMNSFPTLDNSYGALLLGTCISLILYGVSLHQLYRYFRLYSTDTPSIRTLVIVLMILETLLSAFLAHTCYHTLVTNYFKPLTLLESVWSLKVAPMIVALITCEAQVFFVRRASLLGHYSRIASVFAIIALCFHFGLAIAAVALTFRYQILADLPSSADWLYPASVFSATVADLLLASVIFSGLQRSHANCGCVQERDPICMVRRRGAQGKCDRDEWTETVVLYIVNTGLLTGIFNAIPFILAVRFPRTLVWAAFNCVSARLYANTLLSVLNSRKFMVSREIKVFGPDPASRGIFARADRFAAVEQWGAPQLPDNTPAIINITVSAETEGDGARDVMQKATFQ
ncbi:hypothetical protein C8Q70DRAFT_509475 [Cubamyces menziesii]|nr:hypothetical protein C8Q70DRAFT_509475 [Cubamyces menziesii]